MLDQRPSEAFRTINAAYGSVFRPGRLSLGLVAPMEAYPIGQAPTMARHLETARLADRLGFSALWLRDVPFDVPSFGDPGQMFDPFVYLGTLASATDRIALGVASLILPLRHPAHVAKAAATADVLSNGRLLAGIASGDRPEEYPAMNMSFEDRAERFRDSVAYIRAAAADRPRHSADQGELSGALDLLPKPVGGRLPLLITGGSRQSPQWVAGHGDGWITYPRAAEAQARVVAEYRRNVAEAGEPPKPVMQSLYVDLVDGDDAAPSPIHLGFRSGPAFLRAYLAELQALGVNHVALNLRFNQAPIDSTLQRLAEELLPSFS